MTNLVAIGDSSFGKISDDPMRRLIDAGYKVKTNPLGRRLKEEEVIEHIREARGLIAGLEPLTRRVLSSSPSLKAIARVGIGIDNIDLDAAKEYGIKVSRTPDAPTESVAELTVGALLSLYRRIGELNRDMHECKWFKSVGEETRGKDALIVGYGRIGKRVSEIFNVLGMKVMVFDPNVNPKSVRDYEQFVSLDYGLSRADVVSLHAAGRETILRHEQFQKMKQGAILLNPSRGELVDERALIYALDSKKLEGAWFDCFWEEPYRGNLVDFENVLLTPHVGSSTKQSRYAMEMGAVENLIRDLG